MAIDEQALDATIQVLKEKIRTDNILLAQKGEVLSSLRSIQKDMEGKLPQDRDKGEIMTEERREEIYAICKPKADAYI
jgi:hypothetical protein